MKTVPRIWEKRLNGVLVEYKIDGISQPIPEQPDSPNKTALTKLGLGDIVAAVATPIARVLGLPCIDPKTKQLRPESGCGKRKTRWNALTAPSVPSPHEKQ